MILLEADDMTCGVPGLSQVNNKSLKIKKTKMSSVSYATSYDHVSNIAYNNNIRGLKARPKVIIGSLIKVNWLLSCTIE